MPWEPNDFDAYKKAYESGVSNSDLQTQFGASSIRKIDRFNSQMRREGKLSTRGVSNQYGTVKPGQAEAISEVSPHKESISYRDEGRSMAITLPATRIKSLPELLAYCEVDEDVWAVDTFDVNKWEMGAKIRKHVGDDSEGKPIYEDELVAEPLFQVKAKLKRRDLVLGVKEVLLKLFEDAGKRAPKYAKVSRPPMYGGKLLELNPVDHHLGKLAWGPETGEDYDIHIARQLFVEAMKDLVVRARRISPIQKILLILGNDLLQIDNPGNTTTAGTHVDVDSRFAKVYLLACEMLVEVIDKHLLPVADVDILMVPGNHDRYTTFHLGEYLKAWYRNCPQVTIDNRPTSRKYYQYGKNLFLFAHGDTAKAKELPQIMASEQKKLWAATDYRFVKTGHYHKKMQFTRIDIDENYGVQVQICPTLCAADAWHNENGFIANMRRSEAYIYDFEHGPEGSLTYTVR